MTDCEALYSAILASPDDDTLRLIYADALEEGGEAERAAFIRSQIEDSHVPEYEPGAIRRAHIEQDYQTAALSESQLPQLPEGLRWAPNPFRRGFPAAVQTEDADAFLQHAADLFSLAPVESLELTVARLPEVQRFARSPWHNRLVRLSIAQGLGRHAAGGLLGATDYQRLRELHIGAGLSTPSTTSSIVRSRTFRQLTALSCRDDGGGGRTVVNELVQLSDPPNLKTLDLSGNRLSDGPLRQLLAASTLKTIEKLDLSENNLGAVSTAILARAELPQLRSLQLNRTRPEEDGVRELASAKFLRRLRSLSLGGNHLHWSAAESLAASEGVANLSVLDLRENRLGDFGAAALAQSPNFQRLLKLDLSDNQIEDDGADELVASPHLEGLLHLNLSGNLISEAAAKRLRGRFGERVAV